MKRKSLAPVKHPLNFSQVERSDIHAPMTRLKSKTRLQSVKIDFNGLRVIESDDFKTLGNTNNKPMNTYRLREQAEAIIKEAVFIGIIRREYQGRFLNIALINRQALYEVKEILRMEKAELVKRYDELLRNNKLAELDQTEYEKLYKAKYLVAPKGIQKQL
jgi:hypothetical protein